MVETIDPNVFFAYEMLGGTLGAMGGGIAGFFLGVFLCLSSLGDTGGVSSLACIAGGALGYLAGTPLGAIVGVGIAGHLNHVQGNLLLSFLGASAGEGVGILAISSLGGIGVVQDADLGLPLLFFGVPLISGLGATLGYNVNARFVLPEASAN